MYRIEYTDYAFCLSPRGTFKSQALAEARVMQDLGSKGLVAEKTTNRRRPRRYLREGKVLAELVLCEGEQT